MITAIDIHNFRCFKQLRIDACSRVNIIVGDNGSGKTALLEAIFLALCGSIEVTNRFRLQRGNDNAFVSGTTKAIEESIWRPFFYDYDWQKDISISIDGDFSDKRSVVIGQQAFAAQYHLDLAPAGKLDDIPAPLAFTWTNARGITFPYNPSFTQNGINIPVSFENLPNYFHFPSGQTVGSVETADRFAALRRMKRNDLFVELFKSTYNWIEDIGLDVQGGSPIIAASIKGADQIIPITNVSGAVNRLLSILLSIASRDRSIIAVDEIENGVYYKHFSSCWKLILDFSRLYNAQLFMTTHSLEWIKALFEVCGDDNTDISIWRLERGESLQPDISVYSGAEIRSALEFDVDPRGREDF